MRHRLAFIAISFAFVMASAAASFALDPLGTEFQVNTYTSGNEDSPSISPLSGGNFVIVWESGSATIQQDGSLTGVFGQRFSANGSLLGTEFQVNVFTTDTQEDPSVAAHGDGSFLVVWDGDQQDGSEEGVFARLYPLAGLPGSEFRVNTYTTDFQTYPDVAATGDGFVVVWESIGQDGSYGGIFGRRLSAAGDLVGSEFRINTYTQGLQRFPAVAANPDGAFVVAWESEPATGASGQDGSDAGIFGQRFAAGGAPLGTEFQINTYTTDRQTLPDVAVANDGSFVIAWEGRMALTTIGPDEVSVRRFGADGEPLGTEFLANSYFTAFEEDVAISLTSSGDFLVTWETEGGGLIGSDDDGESIVARQLSAAGDLVGSEFQVNTHTGYDQNDPAVAGLGGGGFAVAWRSELQDGDQNGVFAQLLAGEVVCGDATGDGKTTASDALQALKTAVGSASCALCACDVNNSGAVNATDALIILRVAVGQSLALVCPAC